MQVANQYCVEKLIFSLSRWFMSIYAVALLCYRFLKVLCVLRIFRLFIYIREIEMVRILLVFCQYIFMELISRSVLYIMLSLL